MPATWKWPRPAPPVFDFGVSPLLEQAGTGNVPLAWVPYTAGLADGSAGKVSEGKVPASQTLIQIASIPVNTVGIHLQHLQPQCWEDLSRFPELTGQVV